MIFVFEISIRVKHKEFLAAFENLYVSSRRHHQAMPVNADFKHKVNSRPQINRVLS